MTRVLLTLLIVICTATGALAEASAPGTYVVTAGILNARLAPNAGGKIAMRLARNQRVGVYEVKDGWARISPYFDGADEGLSGKVARWVFATHLAPVTPARQVASTSTQLPAKPALQQPPRKPIDLPDRPREETSVDVGSPIYVAIKASDDLARHRKTFVSVSEQLVSEGLCKLSDFQDIGGWWRSTAHQPEPVYYTYCGGATNNHRIYVNTATGEVFR